MASNSHALFCALMALVLWTSIGWVIARRLPLGAALVLPMAPSIGWAAQNVVALVLSLLVGFSVLTTLASLLLLIILAFILAPKSTNASFRPTDSAAVQLPAWIYLLAAILALVPAAAVMPKIVADGVILAGPIFDHSKVALINEMMRSGVPPANPIFAEDGGAGRVSYYYLWHFGAAQIGRLSGASGWEADIASSWFTGFASLTLMCGLALHFCRRTLGPLLALIFSATASVRPVLVAAVGEEPLHQFLKHGSGFAGWLFQMSWSPHHVAAACCVVIAVLLMVQLAQRPTAFVMLTFMLISTAGFESSLWIGGITFALSAAAVGLSLLVAIPAERRSRFIIACMIGMVGTVLLASPLITEQIHAASLRGGGLPITIHPFPILGVLFPEKLRYILDIPAYWCVLLLIEFPLVFIPGLFGLRYSMRSAETASEERLMLIACTTLSLTCLCCSWLLLSTVGDNNDLGWRAVLPGLLVLTAFAATAVRRWLLRPSKIATAVMAVVFLATLPDTKAIMSENILGHRTSSAAAFAEAPAMWAAVRKYTPTDARIANNPAFLQDVTPWQINISWALMADRRSCFAGNELAIAFASLSPQKRAEISELFQRIFDGKGMPGDIAQLVNSYGCRVAVVTPQDGAWGHDPFATSPLFRLAEILDGKWRIYVAVPKATASDTTPASIPTQ